MTCMQFTHHALARAIFFCRPTTEMHGWIMGLEVVPFAAPHDVHPFPLPVQGKTANGLTLVAGCHYFNYTTEGTDSRARVMLLPKL